VSTIKVKIQQDFPGLYTVVSPVVHDRILHLVRRFPLTPTETKELLTVVVQLAETEALAFLEQLEIDLNKERE